MGLRAQNKWARRARNYRRLRDDGHLEKAREYLKKFRANRLNRAIHRATVAS